MERILSAPFFLNHTYACPCEKTEVVLTLILKYTTKDKKQTKNERNKKKKKNPNGHQLVDLEMDTKVQIYLDI